jgi:hypothetical protein
LVDITSDKPRDADQESEDAAAVEDVEVEPSNTSDKIENKTAKRAMRDQLDLLLRENAELKATSELVHAELREQKAALTSAEAQRSEFAFKWTEQKKANEAKKQLTDRVHLAANAMEASFLQMRSDVDAAVQRVQPSFTHLKGTLNALSSSASIVL